MYDFLLKHGQTVSFGLGTAITAIFIITVMIGVGQFDTTPTVEELYPTSIFDFGLYSSYFLVIICALAALLFPLYYAATNPKSAIVGVASVGAILVVFGIAYAMSSSEITTSMKEFDVNPGTGRFIGAAITTTMVLAIGAIVAMVIGEIRAFIK